MFEQPTEATMQRRNKVKLWVVDGKRLLKGSLRQVENRILSEHTVAEASPEDAHALAGTRIEDVSEEP